MLKTMQRIASRLGMNLKRYYSPKYQATIYDFQDRRTGETIAYFYNKRDAKLFLEEIAAGILDAYDNNRILMQHEE